MRVNESKRERTVYEYSAENPAIYLDRSKGSGSRAWTSDERDENTYEYTTSMPTATSARTSWWLRDARDVGKGLKFKDLFLLQHNRGGAKSMAPMEYEKGLRVRQDFVIDRKRCDAILQGLDVRKPTRKYASNRTAEIDLRGFNSHHGGFDGACIAFALLYEHESAEQAKKSRIASQVDERDDLDIDVDALADYVFGKYGGEA